MFDASYGGSFMYQTLEKAWKLFAHLSENSHLHATSSHFDLPRQLGSKWGIYEVSYSIDLFSKVHNLVKKFDQLLCMNKVSNAPSMQGLCPICASFMHAYVDYPCIGKSDYATEQVNAAQGIPSSNRPYYNTYNHGWRNYPNFYGGLKILRILKRSLADLPLLVFKSRDMLLLLRIKLHLGALV